MKNVVVWTLAIAFLAGYGLTEARSAVAAPAVDIWMAAGRGDIEAIRQHVAAGTDLDARRPDGNTPLIVAAVLGQAEAARVLVEHGAELNARNDEGSTALTAAAFLCRRETVELLLENGAEVNARNNAGQTALDAVSSKWSPRLEGIYGYFAGLLQIDLDIDEIKSLRPVVADVLREHGGKPGSELEALGTDIWTAAAEGNVEAIKQHVAAGTDLNAKEPSGSTPLIVAAVSGQTEAARVLVKHGAKLEARNNEGSTALIAAAFLCHRQTVEFLLESGAKVNARNNAGQTALDTVSGQWSPELQGIYGYFAGVLQIDLDLDEIKSMRPVIVDILREHDGKPGSELEARAVEYTPLLRDDWDVSTPAEQGLDPALVADLYRDAAELETLYGLLVIKNDLLIAEGYFNEGSVDQLSGRQSATKSFTSALVGVALDQGCLSSVDQKMVDFFPELADQITDPRKNQITIRELLQMRAGYPWEGRTPPYFDILYLRDNWQWLPHLADFPLTGDPGSTYGYSNLTSHILAVIVARACDTDLKSYAQEHLLSPIGAEVGDWTPDPNGYNWGWGEIYVTARDMAKFGLLYLNDGEYEGKQVISADWVSDSLQRYSEDINFTGWFSSKAGRYFSDIGYGYQWWSARAGDHRFDFAWGHGGQLIILLDELDMIIVTTADPLYEFPEEKGWKYEGAIIDLVGKFIDSLPAGDASKPD